MRIYDSWTNTDYASPVMMLLYCKNTTENGNWCKSSGEVESFLGRNNQYFTYQDTRVQNPIVDEQQFSTVNRMIDTSSFVELGLEEEWTKAETLYYGVNQIVTSDTTTTPTQMETEKYA